MTDVLVPTMPFSPAKSQLSEVMTEVVFRHQIRVVSRHNGKEQMLLVGADDLVAMLAGQEFDVRVVFDEGEVTTFVEGLDVVGFGETLDEAIEDLLNKLREYTTRYFQDLTKYLATSRRTHGALLLRFALVDEAGQRAMLGLSADSNANLAGEAGAHKPAGAELALSR